MIKKFISKKALLLLMMAFLLCTACSTSKKARKVKGCDCPRWSKAEIEVYQDGQEKV
jgi:hypothetical protein